MVFTFKDAPKNNELNFKSGTSKIITSSVSFAITVNNLTDPVALSKLIWKFVVHSPKEGTRVKTCEN